MTLALSGELDSATASQLDAALNVALQRACRGVVVDTSSLAFIGAAGFRSLERAQQASARRGKDFVVLCDPWKLRIAKLIPDLELNVQLAPRDGGFEMRARRRAHAYGVV